MLSSVSPDWLKFGTYLALLPLILLQAAGFQATDQVRAERWPRLRRRRGRALLGDDDLRSTAGDLP